MSNDKPQVVVIVGQGYVGLPVAMRAVEAGYSVVGVDLDEAKVASLNAGQSYVDDITNATLAFALDSGSYIATSDYADTAGFDFAVVTVPTPLREGLPDLSFIESSAESLAAHLTVGATVVLESTTYPGTTEELFTPILEAGSGLSAGDDFYVGYSPERIDPGNPTWGFANTPKVVSGINTKSLTHVAGFYNTLVDQTVPVSSPKEAELTKLLENTFRHVNIALVNELAVFGHQLGVNVWEAIDAASTKPFGYMRFTPGPGVGGHCLPVDPSYLSWQVRRKLGLNFRFVELANDINDHMPDYVVQRIMALLNTQEKSVKGSAITLLGLAYKKNSADVREAPSLRLIELLLEYGATVSAADPHIPHDSWPLGVRRVNLDEHELTAQDVVVLITDHDAFNFREIAQQSPLILDTKNRMSGSNIERL